MSRCLKESTRMNVHYSYGPFIGVLLTFVVVGVCTEDPALTTVQSTPLEAAKSTALPSAILESAPGWWVGPVVPNITSEADREPGNEMLQIENETLKIENVSLSEFTFTPVIIIRYSPEGPPEVLVGSLIRENGTYIFENENVNGTKEESFDVNDFNLTGFPIFPVEEVHEEIIFDTPNGTEIWIDDIFVIPDKNVTEGNENITGQVETTAIPTESIPGTTEARPMEETQLPSVSTTQDAINIAPM